MSGKLNMGVTGSIASFTAPNHTTDHNVVMADVGGGASIGISATGGTSSALNTTETIIASTTVGTGIWQSGTTFKMYMLGTCTATVANLSTFTLRAGTLGTTGDASIATFTVTSAAAGTNIPFVLEITFAVSATGATGAISGTGVLLNSGTTGIATSALTVTQLSGSTTLNTTSATALTISYKSAATTTTCTFQPGRYIQLIKN